MALRAAGIGDLCTAVPALRALRRAVPHTVALAAPSALSALVAAADVSDAHLPFASLDAPWPSLATCDVAVNLHGPGPESIRRLEELAPRRLVSHRRPGDTDRTRRPWDEREHERLRWCRLVAEAFAVTADPDDLRIVPPPDRRPGERTVVMHVGAGAPARRWPTDRFAAVAAGLIDRGWPVTLTAGASDVERRLGQAVLADLPVRARDRVRDRCGRLTLHELLAIVARARLVVSGDTGVGHLASAYGRPSVLLFGPSDPAVWGPPAAGPHLALWAGRRGDPNGPVVDPGLLEITAVDVLAAADRLPG